MHCTYLTEDTNNLMYEILAQICVLQIKPVKIDQEVNIDLLKDNCVYWTKGAIELVKKYVTTGRRDDLIFLVAKNELCRACLAYVSLYTVSK